MVTIFLKNLDFLNVFFYLYLFGSLFLYYIVPLKYRKYFLLIISLLFYFSNGISAVIGVLWLGVVGWIGGYIVDKITGDILNNVLMVIFIFMLLIPFLLGRFYSMDFFSKYNICSENSFSSLFMFLGISYTMCMSIGYLIDIKMKRTERISFINYLISILFFPYAVSGPIERVDHMNEQIEKIKHQRLDLNKIESGGILILYGLFVKLVIADRIALLVNNVLDNYQIYLGFELVCAIVLYAFQLYTDFMGCSNIARGIARCYGLEIVNNFEQPYFSESISDFWHRWHISLSSWLRDYIYIPLGGNRKGKLRKYFNLFVTFLVSGTWHGFKLNFIIWGMLHAIYQIIENCTDKVRLKITNILHINRNTIGQRIFRIVFTFILVDIAWIFFRIESVQDIFLMLKNIIYGFNPSFFTGGYLSLGLDQLEWNILMVCFFVVFAIDMLSYKNNGKLEHIFLNENVITRYFIYMVLLVFVLLFGIYGHGYNAAGFIYRGF